MAEILRTSELVLSKRKLAIGSLSKDTIINNMEFIDVNNLALSTKTREELELVFLKEISELKEVAHDEGFNKGYEDGRQTAQADFELQKEKWQRSINEKKLELENTISTLEKLLINFQKSMDNTLENIEPIVVDIAFAGLTQLLGQSEHYRERLVQQVRHALDQFGHETPTRILLNPEDSELLRGIEKLSNWSDKFIHEETLKSGSCIIEAGHRSLEAGLIEQLTVLSQILLKLGRT